MRDAEHTFVARYECVKLYAGHRRINRDTSSSSSRALVRCSLPVSVPRSLRGRSERASALKYVLNDLWSVYGIAISTFDTCIDS